MPARSATIAIVTSPFFLRIFRRDVDGSLTGETTDGALHPLTWIDDEQWHLGDVLRVIGSEWESRSRKLGSALQNRDCEGLGRSEGACRRAEGGIVDAANSLKLQLVTGCTVRLDARNSIIKIISIESIRREPIQIDRDDDSLDVAW